MEEEKTTKDITNDLFPPQETKSHTIFTSLGCIDEATGKLYTDLTGQFPMTSQTGMKYICFSTNMTPTQSLSNH